MSICYILMEFFDFSVCFRHTHKPQPLNFILASVSLLVSLKKHLYILCSNPFCYLITTVLFSTFKFSEIQWNSNFITVELPSALNKQKQKHTQRLDQFLKEKKKIKLFQRPAFYSISHICSSLTRKQTQTNWSRHMKTHHT